MAITKSLTIAAALLLTAALAPAFAHDDNDDYSDHRGYHRQLYGAHQRAHEEGFYSRGEHRAYHRALRDLHEEYHEDRPVTWQDHYYQWRRPRW
jgi:hypothetical protein